MKRFKLIQPRILSVCALLLTVLIPGTLWAQNQGPQQAVERFLDIIHSMDFPVQDLVRHGEQVQEANAYLDLEAMGKKALTSHWLEAAEDEQKAFFDLLWKLIEEVAYPKSHRFIGDAKIDYPEVRETEDGFEVQSVIRREEEGLDATVVYRLTWKENHWKIDDVILDEVSIIEDLKYQFDKIIAESKFSGLLDKMRERLDRAKKENAALS